MRSRPIILALVILVFGTLLIVPLSFGSIFLAYASGGTSLYLAVGVLIAIALVAALIAARRFFHRP
ncbi:hypothetical protein ACXR0O_09625 [Verrucomicrobiota bacterium sgz303538]